MIDYQTVGRPYWDNPAITIYRSEYDEKTHRALDRYGKTDEFYKRTGCGEFIVLFSMENNRKLIQLHFNRMILTLSEPSRICNTTGVSREIIIQ